MANAFDYSQTPASNTSASPDGAAEDIPPSAVNNIMRKMMANIAGAFTVYTAGGTANAQTVTMDPALTAYSTKVRIAFKPVADNTGACTLNVNGLGAQSIKRQGGQELYASALQDDYMAVVQYDGTNFILLNPAEVTGSFTGTLTGCTTSPTGTINYVRSGGLVTLDIPTIEGTSNTTEATITGMPSSIWPSASRTVLMRTRDNGTRVMAAGPIGTTGVITLFAGLAAEAFTASGTKGVQIGTASYIA